MKHPFTSLVSGPTGSGKTSLVKAIIEQKVIDPFPKNILWLYAADQPLYKGMKGVTFYQGLPEDIEERFNPKEENLLIIDDLMTQCHSDERMTRLFSVGSSHKNLSIIFIVHNLFHQGKEMRNISLNTHYIILFKNPRDSQQIATLARQMYPGKSHFLIEAYQDATKKPYGYVFIDLKPKTNDQLRIRGGILPNDTHYVYVNKIVYEEEMHQFDIDRQDVQTSSNESTFPSFIST